MSQQEQSESATVGSDNAQEQKAVTLPADIVEEINAAYPTALNESEAIRQAIADGLEFRTASEVSIRRED